MAANPITSWQMEGGKVKAVIYFIFLGSKITANGDCDHKVKSWLILGRKAMTTPYQPYHTSPPELWTSTGKERRCFTTSPASLLLAAEFKIIMTTFSVLENYVGCWKRQYGNEKLLPITKSFIHSSGTNFLPASCTRQCSSC